jgi:tripartite-type tricarboxylate transporter receptor subunit TctC
LVSVAFLALAAPAGAQSWPQRPVTFIVSQSAGASPDVMARMIAAKLAAPLGQQVIIENKPGAGNVIGAQAAARAAPDGYTFLVTSASFTFAPGLYKDLPYDAMKDFKPLSMLTTQPLILGVHPSMPVKSVKDLIAVARKRPKDIFYGSAGVGSNLHMTTELFNYMARTSLVPVAYKGGGPALVGLITGEVQVAFMGVLSSKPFRKSGQVRALAVSTRQRSPAVPEIPTIDESGVPGYDKGGWTGMFAPARVPDAIIDHVYQAVAKALKDPEAVRRLADDGLVAVASSPAEFTKFVADEIVEWTKLTHAMHLEKRSLKGG